MITLQWLRSRATAELTPAASASTARISTINARALKAGIALGLGLAIAGITILPAEAAYRPPTRRSSAGPVGNAARRTIMGCDGKAPTALTTLAPWGHIGQTASSRPTFAWYMPDTTSYPLRVSLFEYDGTQALGHGPHLTTVDIANSHPGVMHFTLPEHLRLSPGKTYLWQVEVLCNANSPSDNQIANAVVEVVALPADLRTALDQTRDPLQQSQLYSEAGLWYDALAATLVPSHQQNLSLNLLQQLSQLETTTARTLPDRAAQSVQHQAKQLQQLLAVQGQLP